MLNICGNIAIAALVFLLACCCLGLGTLVLYLVFKLIKEDI